jgi:hypothetical protein
VQAGATPRTRGADYLKMPGKPCGEFQPCGVSDICFVFQMAPEERCWYLKPMVRWGDTEAPALQPPVNSSGQMGERMV